MAGMAGSRTADGTYGLSFVAMWLKSRPKRARTRRPRPGPTPGDCTRGRDWAEWSGAAVPLAPGPAAHPPKECTPPRARRREQPKAMARLTSAFAPAPRSRPSRQTNPAAGFAPRPPELPSVPAAARRSPQHGSASLHAPAPPALSPRAANSPAAADPAPAALALHNRAPRRRPPSRHGPPITWRRLPVGARLRPPRPRPGPPGDSTRGPRSS
jgi:hypothetical protein